MALLSTVERMLFAHAGQEALEDAATGFANDVAQEEEFHISCNSGASN